METIRPVYGLGKLVLDVVYKDDRIIGINGGGTVWNTIYHLSMMGVPTNAVAICGDDYAGHFALESLKEHGVDISKINLNKRIRTRIAHIDISTPNKPSTSLVCPKCGQNTWSYPKFAASDLINSIPSGSWIIIDSLSQDIIKSIKKAQDRNCKILLDIGHIGHLRFMPKFELREVLIKNYLYININERVSKFLISACEVSSEKELFSSLGCEILTITKGEKGATFYSRNAIYDIPAPHINSIGDLTGAGDAFFASIIKLIYSTDDLGSCLKASVVVQTLVRNIVEKIGARGYIYTDGISFLNICTSCQENQADRSKPHLRARPYRLDVNVNNLLSRTIRALESGAAADVTNILHQKGLIAFIGTGGSFSAAVYASRVYNEINKDGYSLPMHPRDYLYINYLRYTHVVCISYSGNTHDIDEVINASKKNGVKCYLITKSSRLSKTTDDYTKIISYNNSKTVDTRERGFLSIAGIITPVSLFAIALSMHSSIRQWYEWIESRFQYWAEFFLKHDFQLGQEKNMCFDIFMGDYALSPAIDMESKCIESGLARVTMHEKKDFSHGRFNIIGYQMPSLCLYYSCMDNKYEQHLLYYLNNTLDNRLIVLQSESNKLLAEFDFLIANQFLIKELGRRIRRDLSKPIITNQDEALKLYKYNGKL